MSPSLSLSCRLTVLRDLAASHLLRWRPVRYAFSCCYILTGTWSCQWTEQLTAIETSRTFLAPRPLLPIPSVKPGAASRGFLEMQSSSPVVHGAGSQPLGRDLTSYCLCRRCCHRSLCTTTCVSPIACRTPLVVQVASAAAWLQLPSYARRRPGGLSRCPRCLCAKTNSRPPPCTRSPAFAAPC